MAIMGREDFENGRSDSADGCQDGQAKVTSEVVVDPHRPAQQNPVGNKSPPVHTRFPYQKGARGRKKGSKNNRTLVKQAFEMTLNAKINGKVQKPTKAEMIYHQLATKASQGDPKAIQMAIPLMERYLDDPLPEEPMPEETMRYVSVMENLLRMERMFKEGGGGEPSENGSA